MNDSIIPENLDNLLRTEFYLPSEISSTLSDYYLLKWSGYYFQSQYYTNPRKLSRLDKFYQIIFHNQSKSSCLTAPNVMVSFRRASDNNIGYALIKGVY